MNFKVVTKVIIFSLVFVQGLSPLVAVICPLNWYQFQLESLHS